VIARAGAALLAAVALSGCQDILGVEPAAPPLEDAGGEVLFSARGQVVEVADPALADGQVMAFWPIFEGETVRVEAFGAGFATATEFEVSFSAEPPPGAMIATPDGDLAVGVAFLFAFAPEISLPPEGQVSEIVLEDAYAATPRHAVIFNAPADRPDLPWEADLAPGFSCAACAEPPEGGDFELWVPVDCADVELQTVRFGEVEFCRFQ
jgi:hypothetical protein